MEWSYLNQNVEFRIKSPTVKAIRLVLFTLPGVFLVGWILLQELDLLPFIIRLPISLSYYGLIMMGMCAIGLYAHFKEEFRFQNGILTYVKAFRATQSTPIESVASFYIGSYGPTMFIKVVFLDKEGNVLISFLDDGTSLRKGHLERLLQQYQIPMIDTKTYKQTIEKHRRY